MGELRLANAAPRIKHCNIAIRDQTANQRLRNHVARARTQGRLTVQLDAVNRM
jgi:hypothetical protein